MSYKSIKDTVREMMKSGKPIKKSEPKDPFFIGEEDPVEEPSAMDEMTTDNDEVDFSDFEKNADGSKSEPARKETAKETEGTEIEAPPESAETKTEEAGTGTENEAASTEPEKEDKPVASAEPARKFKVTTVDGEEEVDETELKAGYMKGKHYTRSQQLLHEKERRVTELLSDPALLVDYAIRNGVDLKPLVHAQPSIQEIKIPPLPEFATDEQKQQHALLVALAEDRANMAKRLESIEGNVQRTIKDRKWSGAEQEFEAERGDLPKVASFGAMLFFREGQRQYGDKYTMRDAVRDLRTMEGDILQRAFDSQQGKKKIEEIKRQAIAEYSKTKDIHKKENVSGDLTPTTKAIPQAVGKNKFKSAREGAEAAKKFFGIE